MNEIKLPPIPEGMCLPEDIEDYARAAVEADRAARKPLTPEQLADKCEAWLQGGGASNIVDAYEAGARFAERMHGIGA